jgi:hypothetical protein
MNRLNPIITSRELCALLFPHATKLDAEFANLDRSYLSRTRTFDIHFLPTPPLIYPDHMRDSTCHSCGKTGHFASFCPLYKCAICKKTAPKHYQNACPNRNSHTPPPRYRHDYEEEHLNAEDYNFDFDNDAIANMTREPSAKINVVFMVYAALLAAGMFILLVLFLRSAQRARVQPTVPQSLCFDNGSSIFLRDIELSTLPSVSTRPPSHARETTTSPYHEQTPPDYAPPPTVNRLDTPWCMRTIQHDSYWTVPDTSMIPAEEDFVES